jgi:aryl-alcohol dehydrogenase-like predicted oxidoreductase
MEQRTLGRTGRSVSIVGLGTWQLGADWGDVTESEARQVLDASLEAGVTFFDTADAYGDGRSESLIGAWRRDRPDARVVVATKIGRRVEQRAEVYNAANFREWIDRSRRNLGVETLDLVQLHCPPTPVYESDEVFDALDALVDDGSIAAYGVSVEKTAEVLTSIARPGVASVQIVFNAFRLKPLDEVIPAATDAGVAVIARVPLASGLLTGRYGHATTFAANDHRSYNRHGEAFDAGETFSGVDYDEGVEAAREFAALAEGVGLTPATAALAWVAQQAGVTTVIPGARNTEQAVANAAAASVPPLGPEFEVAVRELYDRRFRTTIHPRW